jgi:hypothetical protein
MTTEVQLVRDFSLETLTALKMQELPKPESDLTAEEAKELRRVIADANDSLKTRGKRKGQVSLTFSTSSARVGKYFMKLGGAVKREQFFSEMTLGYLVSFLEAFVKDYAEALLLIDKRRLISSTTLTYEELSRHRSLPAVWRALAAREAEGIGYGSIDDVATYYSKKFRTELSAFPAWAELREVVYRRNLIVHNRGRVNEIYRRKTGYREKSEILKTDSIYIDHASRTILEFFAFVHQSTQKPRASDA